MSARSFPPGIADVLSFPLSAALFGRRARRFSVGASIPDGPLAFTSRHEPQPLSDLEQMLVLTAAAGNTGWHFMITRNAHYAPHLANYSGAAGGRTFPSAAGFHTSEMFFTNDDGVYLFATRDAPALIEPPGGARRPIWKSSWTRTVPVSTNWPMGGCTCLRRNPAWRATTPGASTGPAVCFSSQWAIWRK